MFYVIKLWLMTNMKQFYKNQLLYLFMKLLSFSLLYFRYLGYYRSLFILLFDIIKLFKL